MFDLCTLVTHIHDDVAGQHDKIIYSTPLTLVYLSKNYQF